MASVSQVFLAGLIRGLSVAFRHAGNLDERSQLLVDALESPENKDLTDAQKWQVQKGVRKEWMKKQ